MSSHRKKPFSAKQKKRQLQDKRERKREGNSRLTAADLKHKLDHDSDHAGSQDDEAVTRINEQPMRGQNLMKGYDPNRYRLHFMSESRKEIDRKKKLASEPYSMLPESSLEMDVRELYPDDRPLGLPKRPAWTYELSRQALDDREEKAFKRFTDDILTSYKLEELSYFELNLETWRQLWRVLEMSDILLIICDIRFPALHFPPSLYDYVVTEMKKHVILVLNKIDLVAPSLVVAWKHYLKERYPEVTVVCFTSYPRDFAEEAEKKGLQSKRKRRRFNAVGPLDLLQACENIVEDKVELSSWREKIAEDSRAGTFDDDVITEQDDVTMEGGGDYVDYQHYKDGVLTIGCVGYPNVGKSSLLNGLVGKKVVSISKTPGHTKHFQTIYLTPTVRLCDCPGLVFPSLVSRPLQILAGIYPVAQVREPYSAVEYMARRLDLPRLLDLRHPDDESALHEGPRRDLTWSAMDICYAWAEKRGFTTAKIARPDAYRAANHLLRMSLEARICVSTRPPGYTHKTDYWRSLDETKQMELLQSSSYAQGRDVAESDSDNEIVISDKERQSDEDEDQDEDVEPVREKTSCVKTTNPFALLASDSDSS